MAEFTWFLLGLVGPFMYALTNHIDKHLLTNYFKEDGVLVLIMYSALLALCVVPVALWVDPTVLSVGAENIAVLGGVAVLDVILLWAYLSALNEDEPTVVIIFYSLVPVLGLAFGYFILGETITEVQLLAMAIVITGAAIVSVEIDAANSLRFRSKTVGYMLIACVCWALETTIFKKVALEENVWRSLFWECLILGGVGIGIFALSAKYRRRFLGEFKKNSAAVVSLNVLNEGLYTLGNIAVAFAAMLAPVAIILLLNAFQPIFVMAIGLAVAIFFPKFATEKANKQQVMQWLIAIAISGYGTYMLLASGVEV